MKRLCLMRHAKSDWAHPEQGDAERTLNDRGIRSAAFLSAFIEERGWLPEQALCSTATRARLTIAPLTERLPASCPVTYLDTLYMAMPDDLLGIIRGLDDGASSALIVAHNPGLEMLSVQLANGESAAEADRMADHFPTGSLVVLEFDIDNWADIKSGDGHVRFFGKPRELMAAQ